MVVTTTARTRLQRALEWLEARYLAFRLHAAEQDLEAFRREQRNRALQMQVHEHKCDELRARLAGLGALRA